MNNKPNLDNRNKKPLPDRGYDASIAMYLVLNGAATGHGIRMVRHLINHDTDEQIAIISLLLCIGVMAHTGIRIYEVYQDKKNNKQR